MKGVRVHVALVVLAVALAVFVWTRDKKPAIAAGNVTVWNGRASDIERVAFESKGKTTALESKKDAQGRYWAGSIEGGPKPAAFVSVAAGDRIADALAPLKAVREIGRMEGERATDFGMNEPEGKLTVRIAGAQHVLTVGVKTPGGGDRYVRDDASGIVYAVHGDAMRDLEAGEGTLAEHEPHAFKDADVESVRITAGGKSREALRRGPETKRIWSDPSEPDKLDETLANWLAKIDRLRPTDYVAPQPASPEIVVRLDYDVKGTKGGYLEVAKIPGEPKPDWIVRTERTRQWAKVFAQVAEQVDQDLPSIVR